MHLEGTPVVCGPRGLKSTPHVLYHNLSGGTFANVSKSSGIEKTEGAAELLQLRNGRD